MWSVAELQNQNHKFVGLRNGFGFYFNRIHAKWPLIKFIVFGIKALRHFEEYLGVNVFVLSCLCLIMSLSYHVFVLSWLCLIMSLSYHVFVLSCRCRCLFFGHVMSCLPRAEVGSGVQGVKRERPRKFHDRRISTAVTLSFKDTKEIVELNSKNR